MTFFDRFKWTSWNTEFELPSHECEWGTKHESIVRNNFATVRAEFKYACGDYIDSSTTLGLNSACLSTLPPNTAILIHFIFTKSFSGLPCMGFPGDAEVKNLPASEGDLRDVKFWCLDWEDPPEKEMAIHSSILAWRIPWTEELAHYSPWSCRVRQDCVVTDHAHMPRTPEHWYNLHIRMVFFPSLYHLLHPAYLILCRFNCKFQNSV